MSVAKNKRLRKQTFVLRKRLTKIPPAQAGSGARSAGNLSVYKKNKRLRKQTFVFRKRLTKEGIH